MTQLNKDHIHLSEPPGDEILVELYRAFFAGKTIENKVIIRMILDYGLEHLLFLFVI